MTHPGTNNMMRQRDQNLLIHQQNVNKSLMAQNDFLHQLNPNTYNLAAIQVLYLDSNHNSHATHHWYTIYPKEHYITLSQMRSILMVNRQIATDAWSQVDIGLSDITAIMINTGKGKVLLVNMYNDSGQHQGLKQKI